MEQKSEKARLLGGALAGTAAGCVNGLFGGGGGMLLIPGLRQLANVEEQSLFSTSVSVMLPVSAVSLWLAARQEPLPWADCLPYLLGSSLGGLGAGFLGQRIQGPWMHRALGVLMLWGGWRYLWG